MCPPPGLGPGDSAFRGLSPAVLGHGPKTGPLSRLKGELRGAVPSGGFARFCSFGSKNGEISPEGEQEISPGRRARGRVQGILPRQGRIALRPEGSREGVSPP